MTPLILNELKAFSLELKTDQIVFTRKGFIEYKFYKQHIFRTTGKCILRPNKYKNLINSKSNFCVFLEGTYNFSHYWIPYCYVDNNFTGVFHWVGRKTLDNLTQEELFWNR